jgi:hypothetical protein
MRGRAVVRGKPKPTAATRDRLFEPNHGVRVRLNASLALRAHVPNLGLAPQVTGLGGLQEEREGFGQINGHAWEQCGEGYRALDLKLDCVGRGHRSEPRLRSHTHLGPFGTCNRAHAPLGHVLGQ